MKQETKQDIGFIVIYILCLIAGCMTAGCVGKPEIPADSKCIQNYVYYETSKDAWIMWRQQGYLNGVWCQSLESAVGK